VRTPETLEEFEEASFEGFEHVGVYNPGCWHAPASLDDPYMRYFIGRVQGRAVSVSIGVISDGVVGLWGSDQTGVSAPWLWHSHDVGRAE
jgi:hypothetical protein